MVIFTGRTVEDAIEKGLKELHLSRLKAHIKVVSREKKGFLGFGKKPAQVDIEGINEVTAHRANQKVVKGVPEEVNQKNEPVSSKFEDTMELRKVASIIKKMEERGEVIDDSVKEDIVMHKKKTQTILEEAGHTEVLEALEKAEEPVEEDVQVDESPEVTKTEQSFEEFVASEFPAQRELSKDIEKATEEVAEYVKKIIYEMDIDATVETSHNRRQINLQIETPEAGRVIGYHGKVLKSLQLLSQNFLHDRYSKNFSVILNVHDYVEHRTETLIEFTRKAANRVLETGKDYVMDPMSNSERKIVHKTITSIDGVDSYSEGNDPNRYVVVTAVQ
ncbi:RNA-binding cell elongation regulator Jag/EloR [Streptococcus gallolyticus]|uniref:RNA-binding cell elongation regulator Jag/EloR n=1 Tax=Streptococcus gallolyticus TaxID=315405 RepID=UPI000880F771|nr:RNA-binding cell elongation regulator Jag/EloR [Streptococcus gallolyticus]MCY7151532.1 Jag N-terminal domain-containing protein [Streptococcus gallolyticus subsp. gallolyticus]MCY7171237.1 Jag N-terminal domain-containing protein [Streptococcus gallolyticus subsp. gallolyticus]WAW98832.1 Jag N-terminal domain-containing protein [Streptococcus gallolyticus]SDK04336.1 spoIIIJ-associated protein [Streptococcus gallolyticus]SDL54463.1 spoIIIJ-associated protein [Streptococcus gallolyticus]